MCTSISNCLFIFDVCMFLTTFKLHLLIYPFFFQFLVFVCVWCLHLSVSLCACIHICTCVWVKVTRKFQKLLFSLHNVSLVGQRQVLRLWSCTYTLSHLTRPTISITTLLRLSASVKNSLDLCCPGPRRVKVLFDFLGFQVFSLFTLLVRVDHTIMQVQAELLAVLYHLVIAVLQDKLAKKWLNDATT